MEELENLRKNIEAGNYEEALAIVNELEAMSKEDKLQKIKNFITIILLHLIKQEAEKRTTRSWDFSIRNALREIKYINHRRKAGGTYAGRKEIEEIIEYAYPTAIEKASLEAFEGMYTEKELEKLIKPKKIKQQVLALVMETKKM